jgi:hypothetical protein
VTGIESEVRLESSPPVSPAGAARGSRDARPATLVFAAVELIALVFWMFVGRFQWFRFDDWDFLAARKVADLGDLFRPHNEHWSTIPMLAYRALYRFFGLRDFFPYRLMVVLVHLTAVALLFVVIRRAGVRPWIATAAASTMALLAAGAQNIIVPFQVGFTGALALGLVHLLLADHDGRVDRRDWLGLLAGLMGLMFQGNAVSMVAVVGIAVLLRRGWRFAAFHTVPLAFCYLVWFLAIGHVGYVSGSPSVGRSLSFVAAGLRVIPHAIVNIPAIDKRALFLTATGVLLLTGVALAITERRRSGHLSQLAAPLALAAGAVLFLVMTAAGRSEFGTTYAREGRYIHVVSAMMLPALTVAADAFVRRWRRLLPIAIALFVAGVPANMVAAIRAQNDLKPFYANTRQMVLSIPRNPLARQVPRSLRPEPIFSPQLTVGWLLDEYAHNRLPAPSITSPLGFVDSTFRLSFAQGRGPAPTTGCHQLVGPLALKLKRGDTLGISANTIQIAPAFYTYLRLLFYPSDGTRLAVLHAPGYVILSPVVNPPNWRSARENTGRTPRVCVLPR